MRQEILDILKKLNAVAAQLKYTFVAKDELVDLLIVSAIAQEHLLIVGPPGTAKSGLIKRFALLCSDQNASGNGSVPYFEYLLTRFTEPNELFGPVNIRAFNEGAGSWRDTEGMLPHAEIAFLDEVFKANSAILNALLTILNERIFYNGSEQERVPLIFAIGATNLPPDDTEELDALYDRFLLRVWTDNVEEARFPELFERGWAIVRNQIHHDHALNLPNQTTTEDLRTLYHELEQVDIGAVAQDYRAVVRRIRAEGIELSDRRVIKLLKLIAASALRQGRSVADKRDFWVLRHVWNSQEQFANLQHIVNDYTEAAPNGDVWSPERALKDIVYSLEALEAQRDNLRTDTDYMDFLEQLNAHRRELLNHSSGEGEASNEDRAQRDKLLEQIETMIDGIMAILGEQL